MSEQFHVRFATPADADTIGWHRARMFQDTGDVPPHSFEQFRARLRDRLRDFLTSAEYSSATSPNESKRRDRDR